MKDATLPFPPVIIVGSARSGTTLLTRILERLGLFVGRSKTTTFEALFFQRISKWLLVQCGGGVETPAAIRDLLADQRSRRLAIRFIRDQLRSPASVNYLGLGAYLTGKRLFAMRVPWGWKDPRATFMVPLWLEIFPEARLIHVLRHGVDVAASLRLRQSKILDRMESHSERLGSLYSSFVLKKLSLRKRRLPELRCATLKGGISVWHESVSEARTHLRRLGAQALEVRFEELLTDPAPCLERLAAFSRLPAPGNTGAILESIDKSRAFAYRGSPELVKFTASQSELLAKHGY